MLSKPLRFSVVALAGLAVLSAWWRWQMGTDSPAVHCAAQVPGGLPPEGVSAQSLEDARHAVPSSSSGAAGACLLRADNVMLFADSVDPFELVVRAYELNPQVGGWEGEFPQIHSTSYRIKEFDARQSNEVYVLGHSAAGEIVLECWTFAEQQGSQYFHVEPAVGPSGTPRQGVPNVTHGIVGAQYVAMSMRPPIRRVRRTELLRQTNAAIPEWLAVDPEARYVIIATELPDRLYQWNSGDPARLVLLGDESSIPDLERVEAVALAQHTTEGRLLIMTAPEDATHFDILHITFADSVNAGTFSAPSVLTQAQWEAQGYEGVVWHRSNFQDWTVP